MHVWTAVVKNWTVAIIIVCKQWMIELLQLLLSANNERLNCCSCYCLQTMNDWTAAENDWTAVVAIVCRQWKPELLQLFLSADNEKLNCCSCFCLQTTNTGLLQLLCSEKLWSNLKCWTAAIVSVCKQWKLYSCSCYNYIVRKDCSPMKKAELLQLLYISLGNIIV